MGNKFNGVGASDGIAYADVLILKEEDFNISDSKASDFNDELKLFENSLAKAKDDLVKLKEGALKKLGAEKAEIFDAHISILEDPVFLDEMREIIKSEHKNAAYAVDFIAKKNIEIFEAMEDDYFRERASDIKDVTNRVIKYILGINVIDLSSINKEVIIVANDLTPSETSQLNKDFVKGFVCNVGGRTSHAAIMARTLEIPAVLGLKNIIDNVKDGDKIAVDGIEGMVEVNPSDVKSWELKKENHLKTKQLLEKYKNSKTLTKDGFDKFILEGNIGNPSDVKSVLENGGEGVGLFRSEFLYMDNDHFPTEEEQFVAYKEALEKMGDKLVVIRTLDIGGDKKLSYFNFPHEMNPFLGYRAIRFTLDRRDIFKDQINALLRASAFGKLGIMFPMIATVNEFINAKNFVEECKNELISKNIKIGDDYQVGMMVEIPASAVLAEQFAKHADFFSVGTNDLIQYTMAADRMSENVSYLYQPYNPSILNLLKLTIDGAKKYNRWVGMCGEMAGEENAVPILMGLGLEAFSMSATSIPRARYVMSQWNLKDAQELANEAIKCSTQEEVLKVLEEYKAKLKIV